MLTCKPNHKAFGGFWSTACGQRFSCHFTASNDDDVCSFQNINKLLEQYEAPPGGGGDAHHHVPPSPAAQSSMVDDVFDSSGQGDMMDPSRQSIGEVSIPPSVPSEYQFPWPPKGPMRPIPEESFYSERSGRYDYKYDASGCDVFWCLWALVTYLFDIGSDIFVALVYFNHGHVWWFTMTLSFIVVPAVTMTIFSFALYVRDWKVVGDKATPFRWASRVLFLVLQLGPLLR